MLKIEKLYFGFGVNLFLIIVFFFEGGKVREGLMFFFLFCLILYCFFLFGVCIFSWDGEILVGKLYFVKYS